jgi:NCS1 family nucleobase:cation symporter-1
MSQPTSSTEIAHGARAVEVRSIDYVPLAERHGQQWHLGPLWFMGNAELATLAVGLIGVSLGLNLFWSLIAILLGALFGTFFMAFHSVQGPRLGLAQMIQSRPQFGYLGSLLPWSTVVFLYVGFNVFNTIIGGDSLSAITPLNSRLSLVIVTVLGALLALFGYDWIHVVQRWLTYLFLVVFGIFTIGALAILKVPAGELDIGAFKLVPFLVQFGVTASYQLSWAPYVSDYSRYLPPTVRSSTTFLWTYFGSAVGGIWLMALGAFLLAARPKLQAIDAIRVAGDDIFGGFGVIALLVAVPGMVAITAINMYGGALTLISMADSVRSVQPTLRIRVAGILFVTVASFLIALLIPEDFLVSYNNFLLLLLYFLIPWTAVNLVDFYFVRHGAYAIREIFNPRGMYGRWGWRGLVAYFAGFAAMIPFFSTAIYTGPVASALDGADLSIFVGLPVSAVVYLLLTRTIDVEAERRVAEAGREQLEAESLAHRRPTAQQPVVEHQ